MKMKKSSMVAIAILLLITGISLVSAITGSMGNAKMVLYPEVDGWTNTVIDKTILVKNVNDLPINITLATDQNATEFVELIDETFILQPGEEKKAQFEIKVRREGRYEGRINVFFKPVEGKESGVVLSSTIIVIASKENDYEEEEETEEVEEDNPNTEGNVIGEYNNNNNKISKNTLLTISTAVLALILIFLLYLWGRKRRQSKYRRIKRK